MVCEWLLAAVAELVRPALCICKDSRTYVKNRIMVMENWPKEVAGDSR